MAVTRINNNQISDASAGNAYVGINAATKVQPYSITATKLANNLTYGSDFTVTGNLTVQGNTTAIDTTYTTIEDPILLLASNQTGSPTVDIGFIGERGTSDNIAFVWDESAGEFVTVYTTTGETNTTVSIASYANLHTGNANIGGNLTVNGATTYVGNITGNLNVSGNIASGNILTPGLVSATGTITSSANISGANLVASANVVSVGAAISGNITGGNLLTAGLVSATGNITSSANVQGANVIATANLVSVGAVVSGNITGGNLLTAGLISATGNITSSANVQGANVIATANLVSVGAAILGNVTGGNLLTGGLVSATGTITSSANISGANLVASANLVSVGAVVSGNITGGNLLTGGLVSATGNITSSANINGANVNATSGVTAGTTVIATGNVTGGNLTTAGRVVATGNIVSSANIAGGNLSATGTITSATIETTGNVLVGGNLIVQGNITYQNVEDLRIQDPVIILGTGPNGAPLSTPDSYDRGTFMEYYTSARGNAWMGWQNSSGNMIAAANVSFSGNDVIAVNSYGTFQAGNIYAQSAVTTGNITGGNLITTGLLSATGNITGGNLSVGSGIITTTGNITGGNINATTGVRAITGYFTGNVDVLGNLNASVGVVYANSGIFYGDAVTGNNAAYFGAPGYTYLGSNIVAQFTGNVDNYSQINFQNVNDGTSASTDLVLTADNGNDASYFVDLGIGSSTYNFVDFPAYQPNDAYLLTNGGNLLLNTDTAGKAIKFIVGGSANADVIATVATTGLSVTGTMAATGNTSGGNLTTSGQVSATGNITGGNIVTTGLVSAGTTIAATSNITGGNLNTAGQVVATGNVSGGNVVATALVTGANVTATSNVTGANVIGTTSVTGGNIVISGDNITDTNGRVNFNTSGGDVDFAVNGDTVANVFYVDAGTGTISIGSATQTTNAILAMNATNSFLMPVGNTAQRPGTGVTGMLRFNSTTNGVEVYNASEWATVGTPSFTIISDQQFNGDGSTVAFTLSSATTTNSTIVSINGILQIPTVAYSVGGGGSDTLTFTEAPQTGDLIDVRILTTTTQVVAISNSPGNAIVATNPTSAIVEITGDLIPTSNVAYDLGSTSARWNELWLAGSTITLGNTVIKNVAGGNSIGFFGPDGTTPATIAASSVDTTTIANGTSNVAVASSGGNVRVNVGGTSNVMVVSPTVVAITGDLSVSGNATLSGNILGDRVQNGTTSFDIQTASGNANLTIGGTSNVIVWSTTGQYVTGLISATGNITGGNLVTGGILSVTGNIVSTGSNGVANIGSTTTYFNTVHAKATSAQYADLAEIYAADAEYEPGTVLSFGGEAEVTISTVTSDARIAGVVSTNPSYVMNATLESEHTATVALTGRVPTMVSGAVAKGDMMVSGGNGRAVACATPAMGSVIGKALESHPGGDGVIEVVVGRL